MKVLIISPYSCVASYGVRIISACLKKSGHDSTILFLPETDERGLSCYSRPTINQIIELANDKDLIGISLTSNYYLIAKDLCNKLKARLNIPVVLGGVHPTVAYTDCLDFADYAFRGESELAFSEFATSFGCESSRTLSEIDNLVYKHNNRVIANRIKLPDKLDELPFPDYGNNHYIIMSDKLVEMEFEILQMFLKNSYMTFATRGCPFRCAYCCNNSFHKLYEDNRIFRTRSAQNVINELFWYKDDLEADSIMLDDDAFMFLDKEYLQEFVELYMDKINLPIAITSMNPQIAASTAIKLDILRPLNITFMRMGIQSGSENVRKNIYLRRDTNQDIITTSEALVERGINYTVDIILGNPFEEEDDMIETVLLLAALRKVYGVTTYSLALFPGTDLYCRAAKAGLIPEEWSEVIKTRYGSYFPYSLSPMERLISASSILSENTAKFILYLKRRNDFLFKLAVGCTYQLYKLSGFITKLRRIIDILKKEGTRRLYNRYKLGIKKTAWINNLAAQQ